MAQVERIDAKYERVKISDGGVLLELTNDEAQHLFSVIGRVSGAAHDAIPDESGAMNRAIYDSFAEQGFECSIEAMRRTLN